MRRLLAVAQDQPGLVSASAVVAVGLHFLASRFVGVFDVWTGLVGADVALTLTLYLALLGAAALVAGLAGVVIVFGLSNNSPTFRNFRLQGGKSLVRTWSSTALSGFEAALFSGLAAILAISGLGAVAVWLFELAVLLLAHGALRLVWILRGLIRAVHSDDVDAARRDRTRDLKSFAFHGSSTVPYNLHMTTVDEVVISGKSDSIDSGRVQVKY